MSDMYRTTYHKTKLEPIGCIDLVESSDDGGWYAQEYDFTRTDNATRTSRKIYSTRDALIRALNTGRHLWKSWD